MASKKHQSQQLRSTDRPPIGKVLIHLVVLLAIMGGVYTQLPAATTEAHYAITISPPFRTDGFDHVVTFETLTPTEQELFVTAYRTGDPDDRNTLHRVVPWTDRLTAPAHRFLSIKYVKYRDQYYPITATMEKDSTVNLFRQVLLCMSGFLTLLVSFIGLVMLVEIWRQR